MWRMAERSGATLSRWMACRRGRFLDAPEFNVFHDKGNEENFFDRVDYEFTPKDSIHVDVQYTRSWFQTPNRFLRTQCRLRPDGTPVGNTDQRSKIGTIKCRPYVYAHRSIRTRWRTSAFYLRRDAYNYYPSNNPLADYALDQQQETIAQLRSLTNAGDACAISRTCMASTTSKLGGDVRADVPARER